MYVLSSLNPSAFVPQTKYPEHVWCKLNTMNCELFVGVCYRSNNTEIFGSDLHSTLRNLITEVSNKHVMLMGDFNYPSVNWSSRYVHDSASSEAQLFVDCLDDCFLTQHVKSPTRLQATLDLVITSDPDLVHEVEAIAPLESSDHNMISWKCHIESSHKPTKQTRLNYKKANTGAIKAELQQTDWDSLLDGDIHSSWSIFRNLIWELESKHVPIYSHG